jgi:MFS family permease
VKLVRSPRAILGLLTALNLLNYLDRLVLAAVLERVQDELKLDNFEGGLLATVFLVGYFLTSPIFGRMADRGSRKRLIAFGVAVWSLATIGTGLSRNFPMLVAMRAFVGVGEASYATLAPTIIDDLAPPAQKSRWLAIFFVATPVGSALGYLVGGAIEARWGWRQAFLVAGGPGLLLAATCLLIEEPKKKALEAKESVLENVRTLTRIPAYLHGVLGYAAYTFAVGAFAFWAPTFLFRTFKMPLAQANFVFGGVTVLAGVVGTALGGWISDHAAARRGGGDKAVVRAGLWVCSVGSFIGAPLCVFCFLAPTSLIFFVGAFFCEAALFLNSSPINAVILRAVPEERRPGAMALCITAMHILGDLWSPPLVGKAIDLLPMRLAMMLVPAAVLGSAFFWRPPRAKGVERAAAKKS